MNEYVFEGLDAQNPLGYLASLGLLRVLTDDAYERQAAIPGLAFSSTSYAIVSTDHDLDAIVGCIQHDALQQQHNRALRIAYTKEGARAQRDTQNAICDLKPPPAIAAEVLIECAIGSSRAAALAAAWFSELVQDNNGNTKPTAFHFTAGQQAFLDMVEVLRSGINADDVREALCGPWRNESLLPSLSWDSSVSRNYALRARDPSKEKRGSVPAANWLAVIGLEFFPVVARSGRLQTTAISGGWKDSAFTWPLWSVFVTARTAASVLRVDSRRWTSAERAALGISRVLQAKISRSDQGGSGAFSPTDVALPAR